MILLSLASAGAVSCRHYSPVERHFLRVPAHAAAGLSSIDRAKWLKQSRKQPGFKDSADTRHYLAMTHDTRPPQVTAPEGEVKFFPFLSPDAASRDGAVALNWAEAGLRLEPEAGGSTRLHLLRTQGGRYVKESLDRLLPKDLEVDRYALAGKPGVVFCYRRLTPAMPARWKKVALLKWDGRAWSATTREDSRR